MTETVARIRRPKGATSREAVIEAALRVVDEVGVDALTIRAVASAAGTPPMSLYSHFANKEELLDLMYQAIALRMYADTGHTTWQAQLTAVCHQIRKLFLEHPNWAPLLSRPAPPMVVPLRERLLAMMQEEGISAPQGLNALASVGLTSLGLVLVELGYRDAHTGSPFSTRFERIRRWTGEAGFSDGPLTRAAFEKLPDFSLGSIFESVVGVLITGLETKLRSASRGPTTER
jgi:AcrR family transcriptional regulator